MDPISLARRWDPELPDSDREVRRSVSMIGEGRRLQESTPRAIARALQALNVDELIPAATREILRRLPDRDLQRPTLRLMTGCFMCGFLPEFQAGPSANVTANLLDSPEKAQFPPAMTLHGEVTVAGALGLSHPRGKRAFHTGVFIIRMDGNKKSAIPFKGKLEAARALEYVAVENARPELALQANALAQALAELAKIRPSRRRGNGIFVTQNVRL